MSDKQIEIQGGKLSRRKLLQSIGAVGAAVAVGTVSAAMASGGTYASGSVTDSVYGGDPDHPHSGGPIYDVRRLGAVGDGVADDTAAFELALGKVAEYGKGVIVVPAGTYVITRVLRLYRNTYIKMDDGAVLKKMGDPNVNLKLFVNGQVGDPGYASGYEGDGGLTVIGGTIDLCGNTNPPASAAKSFQAFAIAHADGVHIERVKFINGHNGHIIEFNSSRNVKLLNCLFKDQVVRGTDQYEMVQIDFADALAFPTFGAFDDTPCRDVLVEGCTFDNGYRGVGTHGSKYDSAGKQVFHENIRIAGNQFRNISDIAIKPESYRNAVVSGNTIENTGSSAIAVYSCQNLIIADNAIRQTGLHGIAISRKTVTGGFDEPSVDVLVTDNIVTNVNNSALRAIGALRLTVSGNSWTAIKREGAYVSNTANLVLKNNVMRGVTQDQDGQYYAVRLEGCTNAEIDGNSASDTGYANNYKYAVYVPAGNSGTIIGSNVLAAGTAGTIRSDAADTLVLASGGERFLTGSVNATTGIVTLNDDITKYRSVIVATGSVSTGDLRHEIARGWYTSGFRPGTDYLNVQTSNGKLVALIQTSTQISIVSASDPLRYIIGIL